MLKLVFAVLIGMALPVSGQGAEPAHGLPDLPKKRAKQSVIKKDLVTEMPLSQYQLWERVLKLLAEDHGFTPKDRVEAVLGVHFTYEEKDGQKRNLGGSNLYSMEAETPELGLFKVALFDDLKLTNLMISWGSEYAETPHCLDLKELILKALGWVNPIPMSTQPGRGLLGLIRPEELKKDKEAGVDFNTSNGDSVICLKSPDQYSNCVNGFTSTV